MVDACPHICFPLLGMSAIFPEFIYLHRLLPYFVIFQIIDFKERSAEFTA
eukprot:TRINITY_DN16537_c0_g1_i1.p2 TRINITY_DN16537_c0_g1~~TRINITY_DN16537_c0_g1_i1.p2  ORF type:complete len:50 (+),score=4.27 TRINITY_DN16537_c0_g1_i1:304-453(+)